MRTYPYACFCSGKYITKKAAGLLDIHIHLTNCLVSVFDYKSCNNNNNTAYDIYY